jgi:hypothetical protein
MKHNGEAPAAKTEVSQINWITVDALSCWFVHCDPPVRRSIGSPVFTLKDVLATLNNVR